MGNILHIVWALSIPHTRVYMASIHIGLQQLIIMTVENSFKIRSRSPYPISLRASSLLWCGATRRKKIEFLGLKTL